MSLQPNLERAYAWHASILDLGFLFHGQFLQLGGALAPLSRLERAAWLGPIAALAIIMALRFVDSYNLRNTIHCGTAVGNIPSLSPHAVSG